jgi:pilus assembly protein FimV
VVWQRVSKPAGTTTEQTMAALVQSPHAFNDGNPNKLKAGVTMKVPAVSKIKALTAEQVNGILHADGTTAPAAARLRPPPRAAGKSAPAAKGDGDVLKLVPAEAAGGQPDGKLSVLEQQVSAREQSLKDAEARIAALEQQLKSLQSGKPMASQAAAVVPAASAPVVDATASTPAVAPAPVAAPAPKPVVAPLNR